MKAHLAVVNSVHILTSYYLMLIHNNILTPWFHNLPFCTRFQEQKKNCIHFYSLLCYMSDPFWLPSLKTSIIFGAFYLCISYLNFYFIWVQDQVSYHYISKGEINTEEVWKKCWGENLNLWQRSNRRMENTAWWGHSPNYCINKIKDFYWGDNGKCNNTLVRKYEAKKSFGMPSHKLEINNLLRYNLH
jgi:hypothetical protein